MVAVSIVLLRPKRVNSALLRSSSKSTIKSGSTKTLFGSTRCDVSSLSRARGLLCVCAAISLSFDGFLPNAIGLRAPQFRSVKKFIRSSARVSAVSRISKILSNIFVLSINFTRDCSSSWISEFLVPADARSSLNFSSRVCRSFASISSATFARMDVSARSDLNRLISVWCLSLVSPSVAVNLL